MTNFLGESHNETKTKFDLYEIGLAGFLHDIGKPFSRNTINSKLNLPQNVIKNWENKWDTAIKQLKNDKNHTGAQFILGNTTYHKHVFWGIILLVILIIGDSNINELLNLNPFDIQPKELEFWENLNTNPYLIKASILLHHFNKQETAQAFLEYLNISDNTIQKYLSLWNIIELIKQADHQSASQDRTLTNNTEFNQSQTIFNILKFVGRNKEDIQQRATEHLKFPLTSLDATERNKNAGSLKNKQQEIDILKVLSDNNITTIITNQQNQQLNSIQNLQKDLQHIFNFVKQNQTIKVQQFFNLLNIVVKRYLYFTPADLREAIPVISLYEHLYSTALLSSLLYYSYSNPKNSNLIVLTLDFSGIQKYIYNINAKKYALKTIRARSALVQLELKSIKRYIYERLNIPELFEISDVAGKVIIALPETKKQELKHIRTVIEERLYNKYKSKVFINFAFSDPIKLNKYETPDKGNTTYYTKLINAIKSSISNAKESKRTPLKHVLFENNSVQEPFVINYKPKENAKLCELCQANLATQKLKDKNIHICNLCAQSIKLGGQLPKKSIAFLLTSKQDDNMQQTSEQEDKAIDLLFHKLEVINFSNLHKTKGNNAGIIIKDFTLSNLKGNQNVKNFYDILAEATWVEYYPMANYSAYNEGKYKKSIKIKSFSSIAKINKNKDENTYLAILKGDVDNLGQIFRNKLKQFYQEVNNKTELQTIPLSYIRTLSFNLRLFFEIFLNILVATFDQSAENNDKKDDKHKLSILYAGGDDFLIIGRWDRIVQLNLLINYYWNVYTDNNPNTTLSTSIYLFKPGVPFLDAVEQADTFLTNAKYFEGTTKNKISLQNFIIKSRLPLTIVNKASLQLNELNNIYLQSTTNDQKSYDQNFIKFLDLLNKAIKTSSNSTFIYNLYKILLKIKNDIENDKIQENDEIKEKTNAIATKRAYLYYIYQRQQKNNKKAGIYELANILYEQTEISSNLDKFYKKQYLLKINEYIASLIFSLYLIRYKLIKNG